MLREGGGGVCTTKNKWREEGGGLILALDTNIPIGTINLP